MTRRRRIIFGVAAGTVLILLAATLAVWITASRSLKPGLERKLTEHLGLPVTIDSLKVTIRPRPVLWGTGLVIRVPDRPEIEPFIRIAEFHVAIGPLSIMRGHVGTVHVGGLKVFVPPGGVNTASGRESTGDSKIIVDHLEAHDAELTIVQRKPDREPMVFKIHSLGVDDVGFGREMPFSLRMTNYMPEGLIDATGSVGPWRRGDPAALPVAGDYKFTLARLEDIRGIGGLLTSTGRFDGRLTEISVEGTTETPDFNLDLGGKPVPLSTTFRATVDGSDGSVRLDQIDAKLKSTSIRVQGSIENLPGPGRHLVRLNAQITEGRIEDILSLSVEAPQPMMTGAVRLTSAIVLPPGKGKVRDRLQLSGRFTLDRGQFTDNAIEEKVSELSRRSRGKPRPDESAKRDPVFTKMTGDFKLGRGQLSLANLTFAVPGAVVKLDGDYSLQTTAVDFAGTLRMDATVSQAVGGFKSIFLKPFDLLFKRDGAGAVVPIEITGTRAEPKTGIRFGKVFSRSR